MTTATPAPVGAQQKRKMPVRENLEAFGIAILMAVLLKYFVIEAYQIPTSSMQPTMMGSSEAGVYDRLVVDKLCYELPFIEPERWDIVVFRYPIRQSQNYVKRLVGLPDERLLIAGGNVYTVGGDGTIRSENLTTAVKPARLQDAIWKNVFPFRYELNEATKVLDDYFYGIGGEWREGDAGEFTVTPRNERTAAKLTFTNERSAPAGGGLVDHLTDGYDIGSARKILNAPIPPREYVQDARLTVTVTPSAAMPFAELRIQCDLLGGRRVAFALLIEDGKARTVVREREDVVLESEPLEFAFAPGTATELVFAHVDDRCLAWVGGEEVPPLDTGAYKITQRMPETSTQGEGRITASYAFRSGGQIALAGVAIDRDQHYLPSSDPAKVDAWANRIIEVPGGHYFMLGDNTAQSVDSRDWTAITIGVDADGRAVDPQSPRAVRKLVGNMRPRPLDQPVDADENPVIVFSENKVVFEDEVGEVWALHGEINNGAESNQRYDGFHMFLKGDEGAWEPPRHQLMFVPREHILGRALLNFWPVGWPTGPFRFGLIR